MYPNHETQLKLQELEERIKQLELALGIKQMVEGKSEQPSKDERLTHAILAAIRANA